MGFLRRLFCWHKKKYFVENVRTESGRYLTVGGWNCKKCAATRLDFVFYG